MRRVQRENSGLMEPGQDLVVAGCIGTGGIRLLIQQKRNLLLQRFRESYINHISDEEIVKLDGNLEQWKDLGATECEDIKEGGVMTALWNLSGAYEMGIEFTLRQIPVKQETIEICEHFRLNPYRLLSEDCLLLTAKNGGSLVRELNARGIIAAVIGRTTKGISRVVIQDEGRGFLERPQPDEIKKIADIKI